MPDPWARNDNGLHHFDRETGACQVCQIALLDAAGLCPGPGGELGRQETIARIARGVPDLEVPLVDRAPDRAVPAAAAPDPSPSTVTPGTLETAGSSRPGAGGDGPCRVRCLAYTPAYTESWARDPFAGMWLRNADPNANGGRGYSAWCRDLELAAVFEDIQTAWNCWQAVSWRTVDGQPDKPLTAYAVELVAAG